MRPGGTTLQVSHLRYHTCLANVVHHAVHRMHGAPPAHLNSLDIHGVLDHAAVHDQISKPVVGISQLAASAVSKLRVHRFTRAGAVRLVREVVPQV